MYQPGVRFAHAFRETLTALVAVVERLDLAPGPGGSRITPLGAVEAQVREVLGVIPTAVWHASMVAALYPSSQIVAHRDPPIQGTRFHLPLVTNPGCWVFHDGVWAQLELGRAYVMDPAVIHGSVNWGTTRRLHLVVDASAGES